MVNTVHNMLLKVLPIAKQETSVNKDVKEGILPDGATMRCEGAQALRQASIRYAWLTIEPITRGSGMFMYRGLHTHHSRSASWCHRTPNWVSPLLCHGGSRTKKLSKYNNVHCCIMQFFPNFGFMNMKQQYSSGILQFTKWMLVRYNNNKIGESLLWKLTYVLFWLPNSHFFHFQLNKRAFKVPFILT